MPACSWRWGFPMPRRRRSRATCRRRGAAYLTRGMGLRSGCAAGPRDGSAAGAFSHSRRIGPCGPACFQGPGNAETHVVVLVRGRVVVAVRRTQEGLVAAPGAAARNPRLSRRTPGSLLPAEHDGAQAPALLVRYMAHPRLHGGPQLPGSASAPPPVPTSFAAAASGTSSRSPGAPAPARRFAPQTRKSPRRRPSARADT